MPTHNDPPPQLATRHTKPTWHNRAGRIDRSACFTITAARLWPMVPRDDWAYTFAARQPPYSAKGKCDRHAELTLYARTLWLLHRHEMPYPLQGDFRTAKTNALRQTPRPLDQPGDRPCAQHTRKDAVLGHGPVNPNRGVGFNMYKILGLPALWQTNIRIQRIVQHAKLKQHFLICPTCSQQPRHHNNAKPPGGRVTKLYLPLCTEREYEDAQLAQLWLTNHTQPNRPLSKDAVQLIQRYGELFEHPPGRQLRCRKCLSLRYGEVKAQQPASRTTLRLPRVKHTPTEQALFLANLPKLLAKPEITTPMDARDACRPGPVAACSARPTSDRGTPTRGIDALSPADKEKLLMLLAAPLPAFKKLEKVKQKTEHNT